MTNFRMAMSAAIKSRPPVAPLVIVAAPVLSAQQGQEYDDFTATASGGVPPYTFALLGAWPPGIVIDSATGAVSGTPSAEGTFAGLSIRAMDRRGRAVESASFAIEVMAAPFPAPEYGLISATNDGSTGQTYTLNAAWTDIQWYRMALAAPFVTTPIAGATGASYSTVAADENYRMVAVGMDGAVKRAAKALHVVLPAPHLLFDFESEAGFINVTGDHHVDNEKKVQGDGCQYIGNYGATFQKNGFGVAPPRWGVVAHYVDWGDDPAYNQQNGNAILRVSSGTAFAGGHGIFDPNSEGATDDYKLNGYWIAMNAPTANPGMVAIAPGTALNMQCTTYAANTPFCGDARVDCLVADADGRPTYVLTMDDGYVSQAAFARAAAKERGLRYTVFAPCANITGGSRLSWDQLRAMNDEGFDIQVDGTSTDADMTGFATLSALEADLQSQIAKFAAEGLPRPRHLCYPNGTYRVNPTRNYRDVVQTEVGNDVITIPAANTAAITIGRRVIGRGFDRTRQGSRVIENVSATQLRVDVPPDRTGSAACWFVDDSGPFYTGKIQAMLKANGIYTARTTFGAGMWARFGMAGRGLLAPASGFTGRTGTSVLSEVDGAIAGKNTRICYTHAINAGGGGLNMSEADFILLLDYLKAKQDAGELDVLTMSQLWARDGLASSPV